MKQDPTSRLVFKVWLVCLICAASSLAHAAKLRTYNFTGANGSLPIWSGNLVSDKNGNLYGTTVEGGANGGGTAFELSASNGAWTETVLYNFPGSFNDGSQPDSGLVFDLAGNLYGTTVQGGESGLGTVYELSPNSSGGWTETVLHSFQGDGDGAEPLTPVVIDKAGNLYGTTSAGGQNEVGAVFELTNSGGMWTEAIIYSFKQDNSDGQTPNGVTLNNAGNLYGTTLSGGSDSFGTVFELSQSNGIWTEAVIYNFKYYNGNHDGAYPYAGVTVDKAGNLYGTSNYGGAGTDCPPGSCGAVYELQRSKGMWTERVLYSFKGGQDGSLPTAAVVLDAAGNLHGTTSFGGGGTCSVNGLSGCGTVFELQKSGTHWVESLFRFTGANGANPQAGITLDKNGDVFGTTLYGGSGSCQGNLPGCGTAFKLSP
jgi:uncharacterized repeat protein (TIGR03803 family)